MRTHRVHSKCFWVLNFETLLYCRDPGRIDFHLMCAMQGAQAGQRCAVPPRLPFQRRRARQAPPPSHRLVRTTSAQASGCRADLFAVAFA